MWAAAEPACGVQVRLYKWKKKCHCNAQPIRQHQLQFDDDDLFHKETWESPVRLGAIWVFQCVLSIYKELFDNHQIQRAGETEIGLTCLGKQPKLEDRTCGGKKRMVRDMVCATTTTRRVFSTLGNCETARSILIFV